MHTVEHRGTGWLDDFFHVRFRESMLHAAVRENLLCPIYTLMPDHIHLIWMGVSKDSDQRRATQFLRRELSRWIEPHGWQHQAHDRVLRREERRKRAFAAACAYIGSNPVRSRLVADPVDWLFTGCVVPGYPDLHPLSGRFWERFWRAYASANENGSPGKIER